MTGSFWLEAVFSASQNSPCEVEPSPRQAQSHFVAVEVHVAEGAVVAFRLGRGLGMAAEVAAGLGAAHGVEQLGGGGGGGADDMQRAAAPVGGHLAAAAGRIGGRAHGLQQHLSRA